MNKSLIFTILACFYYYITELVFKIALYYYIHLNFV